MNDTYTRAHNALASRSNVITPGKVEFVTRMIRMFESIMELPVGMYWLRHGTRPCMQDWRKSITTALGVKYTSDGEDPIKKYTEFPTDGFPDVYSCFLAEFKLAADDPARTLMLNCPSDFVRSSEKYVAIAAEECGLTIIDKKLDSVAASYYMCYTGATSSFVHELQTQWDTRRDFEWCVPVSELYDYAGKIVPSQRQMRIGSGMACYHLIEGYDCGFASLTGIPDNMFLAYNSSGNVFARDTARILKVSHDASYVMGSHRSKVAISEQNAINEHELIEANELAKLLYTTCTAMSEGDAMLGEEWIVTDHLLCNKRTSPSILLIMMGDVVGNDISTPVGMLHIDLNEGVYPARVFTHTGASQQAQEWIKSSFLGSAIFQSFCRRWELKPHLKVETTISIKRKR